MNHVDPLQSASEEYEALYDRPPQRGPLLTQMFYAYVPRTFYVISGAPAPSVLLNPSDFTPPPIESSLTTRAAYDRIVQLEAQVAGLKIERDTAAALVKSLLDQKALLEDRVATLQHRLVALDAPTEQKPSTGDLLARASSFDRPLDAYGR